MPKKSSAKKDPPELFEVEVITGARRASPRVWEFRVKWLGYSEKDTSWQPERNLKGCEDMVIRLRQQLGIESSTKCPVGLVFIAPPSWIKREKERYDKERAQRKRMEDRKPPVRKPESSTSSIKEEHASSVSQNERVCIPSTSKEISPPKNVTARRVHWLLE
ncbi:hypothetical protein PLICRDRAFT_171181 [Plicaturopsis crispa FD-325 SS-3]|nr:hypothetical protein PLICRDRAFT_171181 [Plicaturopsis crispa FD-325 SS-3]